MSNDHPRHRPGLSRGASRRVAAELQAREEAGLLARFRAFLDREGLKGDDRRLALGEIEVEDLRERLRRFFGFGLALAGAVLLFASLMTIFGGADTALRDDRVQCADERAPVVGLEGRISIEVPRRVEP